MPSLTANDLKTRGVAAIEALLAEQPEAVVSVRGKDRFVVMDMAQYHHLRECELEVALAQTHADLAAGRFVTESAQAHVDRVAPSRVKALTHAVSAKGMGGKTGKSVRKLAA